MKYTADEMAEDFKQKIIPTRREFADLAIGTGFSRVQTVNLHHVALLRKDITFLNAFRSADRLTADGWPVVVTLRLAGIETQRVTGSDLLIDLIGHDSISRRNIGLLGATKDVGDRFEEQVCNAGGRLVYREHGNRGSWDINEIARNISTSEVDLLLVAISPPWGDTLAAALNDLECCKSVLAVGGAVDMFTGEKRRSPRLISALGAEWAFRVVQDPRHLARRYFVECTSVLAGFLMPFWVKTAVTRVKKSFSRSRDWGQGD
ncbi:WecB/TagA/CpsF family glycosyltransferase [Rhodococcus globerulus]|uniref:WecB/TagA/CpsF family glycosyltransferase n=1 Tax=Rhodococcus globerulus TaxID=33008 RepID=UPI001F28B396|nr:WecB/TagA/CpsF family glycosyltransferase [Rhodococcus globerulus]MCE4268200.1 WecB/TagA/CpsF family glycosyltransferase [Rhodococcus globerulus]